MPARSSVARYLTVALRPRSASTPLAVASSMPARSGTSTFGTVVGEVVEVVGTEPWWSRRCPRLVRRRFVGYKRLTRPDRYGRGSPRSWRRRLTSAAMASGRCRGTGGCRPAAGPRRGSGADGGGEDVVEVGGDVDLGHAGGDGPGQVGVGDAGGAVQDEGDRYRGAEAAIRSKSRLASRVVIAWEEPTATARASTPVADDEGGRLGRGRCGRPGAWTPSLPPTSPSSASTPDAAVVAVGGDLRRGGDVGLVGEPGRVEHHRGEAEPHRLVDQRRGTRRGRGGPRPARPRAWPRPGWRGRRARARRGSGPCSR